MSHKLTTKQRLSKHYKTSRDITGVITSFNDSMYRLFYDLSFFTERLPAHLNSMSNLSDMITDALVITGRSSLSKNGVEMNVISNTNILFDKNLSTIRLADKAVYDIPLQNNKSYIQTDNSYNIHSVDGSTLLSLNDLLSGTPINIVSANKNYRYTFCIEFPLRVDVNALTLGLNLNTKSYPLLSELYYIDTENKRRYITLLNTLDTSMDLDDKRVLQNNYELLFSTVNTNRLYFTLEDRNNQELMIDKISVKKVEYHDTGEIVLGPVTSSYPILKAALEANGELAGSEFYISHDNNSWVRMVLPKEVNKSNTATKIISYNTVSRGSLKVQGDVKELYLKIVLSRQLLEQGRESLKYKSSTFYTNYLAHPMSEVPVHASVYQRVSSTFYGESTFQTSADTSTLREPEHNYITLSGSYKVKGFENTDYSYDSNIAVNNVGVVSSYKKVNGDRIDASEFNPLTSVVYGYVISKVKRTFNTLNDTDFVLTIKEGYAKDTYTIRQNNKEVKIDLGLGFISSTIAGVIGVAEKGTVSLYDSTGRFVKELTKRSFNNFNYISLVEDEIFDKPVIGSKESLKFNSLYPLKLNEEDEYGILDGGVFCVQALVDFDTYSKLNLEKLETSLEISKENKNTLTVTDDLIKDKYTKSTKESIEAFTKSRAIKLKNKHIKKGSLRITQA